MFKKVNPYRVGDYRCSFVPRIYRGLCIVNFYRFINHFFAKIS
jgi:hypothetical protein